MNECSALWQELATALDHAVRNGSTLGQFLNAALATARSHLSAKLAAVVVLDRGNWRILERSGADDRLPYELLSEALDRQLVTTEDDWAAAPLEDESHPGHLLAVRFSDAPPPATTTAIVDVAGWLSTAGRMLDLHDRQRSRIQRLEAILNIAAEWNQTLEMDQLFHQMAEASTRLLHAERASIFLWDRHNQTLIGRPALGVQEEELRIPDDTGIVGQVVQQGEAARVDLEQGQDSIDRRVDQKLGFETRTLLCVPLRSRSGELFGAFELINKLGGSFSDDDEDALRELAAHAANALENSQQYETLLRARHQMADEAAAEVQLVGDCPAIEALRGTIRRVADTELSILILGENGTGKEVVSQLIHYLSSRRLEPFVAVNCAALTETLLESELFGHEKGAFTDAQETRSGKFELAANGTLFLDEIGDMSLSGQAKLLRVLEEKVVVRVGGSTPIHTGARVIAATNQNLAQRVQEGKFREDLYFRLNVVTLELPPLRDRGDDVLMLAERFLRDFSAQAGRKKPRFTSAARRRLIGHHWPGNVRELRNLMERIAYLSTDESVDADELAFILAPKTESSSSWLPEGLSLSDATRQFQAAYIRKQIDRVRGNMTDAAQQLGLHRANLYRKMRQLDMDCS
jgi:transcriptional regulator with GAF, ATPase, and Fis domain